LGYPGLPIGYQNGVTRSPAVCYPNTHWVRGEGVPKVFDYREVNHPKGTVAGLVAIKGATNDRPKTNTAIPMAYIDVAAAPGQHPF
jgi:hypothetical protein